MMLRDGRREKEKRGRRRRVEGESELGKGKELEAGKRTGEKFLFGCL